MVRDSDKTVGIRVNIRKKFVLTAQVWILGLKPQVHSVLCVKEP